MIPPMVQLGVEKEQSPEVLHAETNAIAKVAQSLKVV